MSFPSKLPNLTTLIIYSLGSFLGFLHIFFGVVALTPMASSDLHREMKINYNAFAKSLSFLHGFTDLASIAFYLRHFIAICQTIFGCLLLENGHFCVMGTIGNYGLIAIDSLFLLFQLSVGSSLERIAPSCVFLLFLITRLVVIRQGAKKVRPGAKTRTSSKVKSSTPRKKNE